MLPDSSTLTLRQEQYPRHDGTDHYTYLRLKIEQLTEQQESKMHLLPRQMCPNPDCEEFGQYIYGLQHSVSKWILYCPYCHIHYQVRFRKE